MRSVSIPNTISYRARRAQDGELVVGESEGQPEYKDSTERVQDFAEEELGKVTLQNNVQLLDRTESLSQPSNPSSNSMDRVAW